MTTYQKHKRGLKKKAKEFAILCGVPTCMIIYGPKFKNRLAEVEVWPKEAVGVLLVMFDNYIELAKRRIVMIKGDQNVMDCPKSEIVGGNSYSSQSFLSPCNHSTNQVMIQKDIELADLINKQPNNIYSVKPLDHHNMQLYHHHQPLQMLPYDLGPNHNQLTNVAGDHYLPHQFGGVSAVLQPTLYFDPTAVMINNQRAIYIYGSFMQTMQTYEQCPPLPSNISSQMHDSSHHHHQFNEFYRNMNDLDLKTSRERKALVDHVEGSSY
ncbi:hypothetical protein JRO89_XSUnG0138900 [Xanthoceras sorbifolium]|uniref:MADS-box domain-containing protein n=1 Tax=Xanthoceras sorbifolium TaxID=99658 RepID=A0ABQ8GZD3_9ROSI|nr:hypothetical protein JRO89_XSUnG0138900 [Xanthoceras sorbifolium]